MKEIPLTRGYVALVDDSDYDHLNQWKWHARPMRNGVYAYRSGQRHGKQRDRAVPMHRQILNAPDHLLVDHINRNTLDNRRSNLRLANRTESQRNRSGATGSTSRFKGVSWSATCNGWLALIYVDRKSIRIGVFGNEEDAARAYDQKAKDLFREFAYLNFPDAEGESAA